jgi:hypothetical protein
MVGVVPDHAIGKVAATLEHRDPGLVSGGTLDFDSTDSGKRAKDLSGKIVNWEIRNVG